MRRIANHVQGGRSLVTAEAQLNGVLELFLDLHLVVAE